MQSPRQGVRLPFCGVTGSFLAVLAAMQLGVLDTALGQSPRLEVDSDVASAGFYQLRWFGAEPVVLEEAQDPEFATARVIYRGSDAARVMSGKPDGVFYYRVRDTEDRALSNVVEVTVRHHSLGRALAFFGLGAIVFLATLLLIATGTRAGNGAK